MCKLGTAVTKVKGPEPKLYEALVLLLVFSLKFTTVKLKGSNKYNLNLKKHCIKYLKIFYLKED